MAFSTAKSSLGSASPPSRTTSARREEIHFRPSAASCSSASSSRAHPAFPWTSSFREAASRRRENPLTTPAWGWAGTATKENSYASLASSRLM